MLARESLIGTRRPVRHPEQLNDVRHLMILGHDGGQIRHGSGEMGRVARGQRNFKAAPD